MVSAFAASFADLCLAIAALEFFSFLDQQLGAGTTTATAQAPLLEIAAKEVMLPLLGAAAAFFVAIMFMYHRLSRAAVTVAGAGNMRLSELVISMLCVSIGMLEYILFVQEAGGVVDHGAQARALGLAAVQALPFAATATFFLGMMLMIIAHVFADEGGDGEVAGEGPIQGAVPLLTKTAVGAAMALICMMVMAFYGANAKY